MASWIVHVAMVTCVPTEQISIRYSTLVQSYTRKYHEFVAVCIVTSAQHKSQCQRQQTGVWYVSVLRALLAWVWSFVQMLGNASQFHSAGSYKPAISNDAKRIVHVLQSMNHTAKSMNHTAKSMNYMAKSMNYTAKSINHTASNQRTTSPCQRKTYALHGAGQCILDNTQKLHWSDREMEANRRGLRC